MAIEHVIQRNNRIICMKHMIGSQCMNMVIQISITLPLHLPFRESLFSSFRYCQVGFIRSGGIEIWPLLVRTVPSGVGDCCEALTSVGVVSS